LTHLESNSARHDGVSRREKESRTLLLLLRNPKLHTLFPSIPPKSPLVPLASHHYQPMADKGESKTLAITQAMTPPATLLAINTPTPTTEASMEDVASFVQPLAMILAKGNSGGSVGATLRSADLPSQLTRGRDIQRPRSAARSPSPLKIARSRARAHSPYGRPSREAPASSRQIVQQLFKDGATIESPVLPQTARVAPVP
jgi:hypothetical protein